MKTTDPLKDPRFIAILNESTLAAEMMAQGATLIGAADMSAKARYYQGLFSLSIGFERAAKLAIVLNFILENKGKLPTFVEIRKFSHSVNDLLKRANSISTKKYTGKQYAELPDSDIDRAIIRAISEFGVGTRYFNLNLLSQASQGQTDPLKAWYENVGMSILRKHYSKKIEQKDRAKVEELSELIGDSMLVRAFREDGVQLTSLRDVAEHQARAICIQKHSRFHLLRIARYLSVLIENLSHEVHAQGKVPVPAMGEVLEVFICSDKFLKSKKVWSIYRR